MNDIVKKSLQFGLGAYAKTRREIEGAVSKAVKKNNLNKKEGEKVVAAALERSKKIEKKVEAQVRQSLNAAIKALRNATKKDLALLEKKVKSTKRK